MAKRLDCILDFCIEKSRKKNLVVWPGSEWAESNNLKLIENDTRHRAAIGLAGSIGPPIFSKIVLKALTHMAFSTEIFSAPICCI